VFTVGASLALVGKQAVATGAWPIAAQRSPDVGAAEPLSV
jgi:hypothetical protein